MGWYDDITSSSGFQIGYPVLSGLLAASSPAGARLAHGVNVGMGLNEAIQRTGYLNSVKKAEEAKLLAEQQGRQKLADFFSSADTTYQPQIETEMGDQPVGNRPVETPRFTPAQRGLGEAMALSGKTEDASKFAQNVLGLGLPPE